MNSSPTTRILCALLRQALLLGCAGFGALASGAEMQALDDNLLSDVQGRDGVSFAVNLNTKVGSSSYTVDNAMGQPTSLIYGNGTATGFHAVKLDIVPVVGPFGTDYLTWAYPEITSSKPLQLAYDLAVQADGLTLGTGVVMQDVLMGGSSWQLSTKSLGGMAFGYAQQLSVANVFLQPNGRGNTTGHLALSGVSIGAASGAGPWVIADLFNQPGRLDLVPDTAGDRIQVGIDFPKNSDPATGRLHINNITFNTSGYAGVPGTPAIPGTPEIPAVPPTPEIPATDTTPMIPATPGSPAIPATPGTPATIGIPAIPAGPLNLGSSTIGSMQIQHLNIKFRAP